MRFVGSKAGCSHAGCTLDMALLRDLFDDYIFISTVLGIENEQTKKVIQARKRLLPYQIGRFGQLQEWREDFIEDTPGNPHTSHCMVFIRQIKLQTKKHQSLQRQQRKVCKEGYFI